MAHIHSVYDSDKHFIIDPFTRQIRSEQPSKTTLVQYDHNSERFTFQIPRIVEGHSMDVCNRVEVHYINVGKEDKGEGVYPVTDLQISPDSDDVVICSWLISGQATQYAGTLAFLVRFVCTTGGRIDYAWNTAPYSNITIADGMYNSETIVEDNPDVFAEWEAKLDALNTMCMEQGADIADLNEKVAELEDAPAVVDLSAFESNGVIVETYADGSKITYTMEFDADGNPTKITDSSGKTTVLTW